MTIRIYPSRLEGEPLEAHETTEPMTIGAWLSSVSKSYAAHTGEHPISVSLNGVVVPADEWATTEFSPKCDVRIFAEARGAFVPFAIGLVLSVYAVYMARAKQAPSSGQQGQKLGDVGIRANRKRYGDPIPEIAGSPIIFPDYLTPPRRYYENMRTQYALLFLAIGKGYYDKPLDQIWIGDTPLSSYGDNVEIQFYEPGDYVGDDEASEWWHTPEEVGFTAFGNSGLDLNPANPGGASGGAHGGSSSHWADDFVLNGYEITADKPVPGDWNVGDKVQITGQWMGIIHRADADYAHYDRFSSTLIDAFNLAVMDKVRLNHKGYKIRQIFPASGSEGGTPAVLRAGGFPARLNFGASPSSFAITLRGVSYTILLSADMTDLDHLIMVINAQLNAAPIRVRESVTFSDRIEIYEIEPYQGGLITISGPAVDDVFRSPYFPTEGGASEASRPRMYALIDGVTNESVYLAPHGEQLLTAYPGGNVQTILLDEGMMVMTITSIGTNSITVSHPDFDGFPEGGTDVSVVKQAMASGAQPGDAATPWLGPFLVAPEGEYIDAFEVDIFCPQGLIYYRRSGGTRSVTAGIVIEWRYRYEANNVSDWYSSLHEQTLSTSDQVGFTYRIDLPHAGPIEVRMRSSRAPATVDRINDTQVWSGLRGRLNGGVVQGKTEYDDITTMSVKIRSGDALSGGVENKISLRPTRILPTLDDPDIMEPTRDPLTFFVHVMDSVGYGRDMIDMDALTRIYGEYWWKDYSFDLKIDSTTTVKQISNHILNAVFSELTVRRGKITPVMDGPRWDFSRIFSPQQYAAPLVEVTRMPQIDDFDGVDLTYIDYETGAEVVEKFRMSTDEGRRVEKISAPGVTQIHHAYDIAMRRRLIHAYRRTEYHGTTEMHMLNCNYLDYVGLQDGFSEYYGSAFVISMNGNVATLSEEIVPRGDYDIDYLVALNRDGTVMGEWAITSIQGNKVTLYEDGWTPAFSPDIGPSGGWEGTTVVLASSYDDVIHPALITSVKPRADGKVDFIAMRYDERIYYGYGW